MLNLQYKSDIRFSVHDMVPRW